MTRLNNTFLSTLVLAGLGLISTGCTPQSPTIKHIATGSTHACSLDSKIDGVICWGDNTFGQNTVPSLSAPTAISAGDGFTCALDTGTPRCWGNNNKGQLTAPAVSTGSSLASGLEHSCVIAGSQVQCWGSDEFGQVSDIPPLTSPSQLSLGHYHSCVIDEGLVKCWGRETEGQLSAPPLGHIKSLSAGGFHNCVISEQSGIDSIHCWGGDSALISDIPTVLHPTQLASGPAHTCVIDSAGHGSVKCWGDTTIGADDTGEVAILAVRNLTHPSQISLGGSYQQSTAFACVRHQQGVACWGDNDQQQAHYDGGSYHSLYRAESVINAPAEHVWSVLMDLDGYPLWNPFTIEMHSSLEVGSAMKMKVRMSERLVLNQSENIRVLDAVEHKACWGIDTNKPEISSGERCQWLEVISATQTRYITEDLVEGTTNPTVVKNFGDSLSLGFEGVANSLKQYAESTYLP